jgi:hypothetical protein
MIQAVFVIFLYALSAILLAWRYFRWYAIPRPPIGVFNLWDVMAMLCGILIIPYLYRWLPAWLVGGLLGLSALGLSYFTFEPVIASRPVLWSTVWILCVIDVLSLYGFRANGRAFFAVNNLAQVIVLVGIVNFWAQSGMKARDCAILAGALVVYDLLFTSALPLMDDLFSQLEGLPFAPLIAWSQPDGSWLSIGLGDLLLAAVFPLVMRKAYGLVAGGLGLMLAVAALVAVLVLPALGLLQATFPVMTVLGPLIVMQYLFWRRRSGIERTTYQYLQAEPRITRVLPTNDRTALPAQRGKATDPS